MYLVVLITADVAVEVAAQPHTPATHTSHAMLQFVAHRHYEQIWLQKQLKRLRAAPCYHYALRIQQHSPCPDPLLFGLAHHQPANQMQKQSNHALLATSARQASAPSPGGETMRECGSLS